MMNSGAAVGDICNRLHRWLNSLPVFSFPFPVEEIPRNGIYVLFENGEEAHGPKRIVRIGTHTGNDQLRSRLTQHFINENKDRSIFRKNIGRSLLNRNQDAFLEAWNLDLTTRAAKAAHSHRVDFEKQRQVEKRVSERIQKHFRFAVIEVQGKKTRLELESKLISTISLCDDCCPSKEWLGLHSPKRKIRESGLWQVNELYKVPLTSDELGRLSLST